MIKTKSQKGFTLMEMLIVVAIIAILVAIAVPVFSSQLTKAKEQVDAANLRSATSMAVAEYLLQSRTGAANYFFDQDTTTEAMSIAYGTEPALDTTGTIRSKSNTANTIKVVITDGAVTSAAWQAA